MNVFLFQPQFAVPILEGVKDCTIRAFRKDGKRRAREGETISLRVWTGLPYRSKQREFTRRVVKFIFPVRVSQSGIERIDIKSKLVSSKMAKALGFQNWPQARAWYRSAHGLPFDGELVHFPETIETPTL